jgi:hypothetical protein
MTTGNFAIRPESLSERRQLQNCSLLIRAGILVIHTSRQLEHAGAEHCSEATLQAVPARHSTVESATPTNGFTRRAPAVK